MKKIIMWLLFGLGSLLFQTSAKIYVDEKINKTLAVNNVFDVCVFFEPRNGVEKQYANRGMIGSVTNAFLTVIGKKEAIIVSAAVLEVFFSIYNKQKKDEENRRQSVIDSFNLIHSRLNSGEHLSYTREQEMVSQRERLNDEILSYNWTRVSPKILEEGLGRYFHSVLEGQWFVYKTDKDHFFILIPKETYKDNIKEGKLELKQLGLSEKLSLVTDKEISMEQLNKYVPKEKDIDLLDFKSIFDYSIKAKRNVFLVGHGSSFTIAGLSRSDIQSMLLFFDLIGGCRFFSILSCYAGGSNISYMLDNFGDKRHKSDFSVGFPILIFGLSDSKVYASLVGIKDFFQSVYNFFSVTIKGQVLPWLQSWARKTPWKDISKPFKQVASTISGTKIYDEETRKFTAGATTQPLLLLPQFPSQDGRKLPHYSVATSDDIVVITDSILFSHELKVKLGELQNDAFMVGANVKMVFLHTNINNIFIHVKGGSVGFPYMVSRESAGVSNHYFRSIVFEQVDKAHASSFQTALRGFVLAHETFSPRKDSVFFIKKLTIINHKSLSQEDFENPFPFSIEKGNAVFENVTIRIFDPYVYEKNVQCVFKCGDKYYYGTSTKNRMKCRSYSTEEAKNLIKQWTSYGAWTVAFEPARKNIRLLINKALGGKLVKKGKVKPSLLTKKEIREKHLDEIKDLEDGTAFFRLIIDLKSILKYTEAGFSEELSDFKYSLNLSLPPAIKGIDDLIKKIQMKAALKFSFFKDQRVPNVVKHLIALKEILKVLEKAVNECNTWEQMFKKTNDSKLFAVHDRPRSVKDLSDGKIKDLLKRSFDLTTKIVQTFMAVSEKKRDFKKEQVQLLTSIYLPSISASTGLSLDALSAG